MAVWRATIFFQYGHLSWSETYHHRDQGADAQTVLKDATDLATAHLHLMGRNDTVGSSPTIPYIRVSDDQTLRDAYVANNLADQASNYPLIPATPCEAWDCLEMRAQVEGRLRRKIFYISCIPSEIYRDNRGIFNPDSGLWIDRYNRWLTQVLAHWGLYYRVPQAVDLPIFAVTAMNRTDMMVELVGVPLPLGGQRIALLRGHYALNSPVIRGYFYTAPSLTANAQIIVPGLTRDPVYTGGATAQLIRYALEPITDVSFVRKTHHKRGVESGLVRRGRRILRR